MFFLNDLPQLLPDLSLVSAHGDARGGGEQVAQNIQGIYHAKGNKKVKTVNHREARTYLSKLYISSVLLTSGPRDYFNLLFFLLNGVRTVIYIQVPYHKAASAKYPIHLIATWIFLLTLHTLKIELFVNSKNAVPKILQKKSKVLLPINQKTKTIIKKSYKPSDEFILVTACRLNLEIGSGSRDIKALIRMLEECRNLNSKNDLRHSVLHFGDVHPSIAHKFIDYSDVIDFCGYKKNWYETSCNVFFFLSNYEGFGLAAYEASQTGTLTIVNEAFPDELISVADNIRRIDTKFTTSIMGQIKNAYTIHN